MRRIIKIAVLVLAVAVIGTSTVFAHHGSSRSKTVTRRTTVPVCNVEDCEVTGQHYHGGTLYCSHYYGDGHDYHGYCDIEDCDIFGYHEHDGVYCFGHVPGDGHDYHEYCTIRGCAKTSYHAHGDEYHFGHTLNDGHGYHRSGGRHH